MLNIHWISNYILYISPDIKIDYIHQIVYNIYIYIFSIIAVFKI